MKFESRIFRERANSYEEPDIGEPHGVARRNFQ